MVSVQNYFTAIYYLNFLQANKTTKDFFNLAMITNFWKQSIVDTFLK